MSKKAFIIILVLSLVVTYGASIVEALLNGSILMGQSGWPLRFGYSSFFGGSSINYVMLILDIVFWFFIIWLVWFGIKRLINR